MQWGSGAQYGTKVFLCIIQHVFHCDVHILPIELCWYEARRLLMNWNSWLVNVYGDNWGVSGDPYGRRETTGLPGAGTPHNMMPYSCAELFNSVLETILIVLYKLVSN